MARHLNTPRMGFVLARAAYPGHAEIDRLRAQVAALRAELANSRKALLAEADGLRQENETLRAQIGQAHAQGRREGAAAHAADVQRINGLLAGQQRAHLGELRRYADLNVQRPAGGGR
jgi:hypothetical protein